MLSATCLFTPAFLEQSPDKLKEQISPHYMIDESRLLEQLLLPLASFSDVERQKIDSRAGQLVKAVREDKSATQRIDALLLEYSLDTREGLLLMAVAEALMRIPDAVTQEALIRDKLGMGDWKSHLKHCDSVFVDTATLGLSLAAQMASLTREEKAMCLPVPDRLLGTLTMPLIRRAMQQAMRQMARRFVLGRDIYEAQKNSRPMRDKGFTHSFDMLGEAALTVTDADRYRRNYLTAIEAAGCDDHPSVSIKLSALHPRYEAAWQARMSSELYRTLVELVQRAVELDVAITIDAEEADRLELSLALFEKVWRSGVVDGWGKFGLAVQAYSKRALPVLVWLNALAREKGGVIPVRLVKGAYWDSEIKRAQQGGFADYPVYTRKEATDVAYLACARFLSHASVNKHLYPQFATHNAHTIAAITVMAKHGNFAFQCLHGMGEGLYKHVMNTTKRPVCIYAPVGGYRDLLPYLVRRLLENGANSSFVHRLMDERCPIAALTEDPVERLRKFSSLHNANIPRPPDMFPTRVNSAGVNIDIASERMPFTEKVGAFLDKHTIGGAIIDGQCRYKSMIDKGCPPHSVTAPYDRRIEVGKLVFASCDDAAEAVDIALNAFPDWQKSAVKARTSPLEKLADLLQTHLPELVALLHREAGKTVHDSIDEVREAVDFCRYYARQAETLAAPFVQKGFDDKARLISRQGRGVFAAISPWNFPLAIFLGQVTAALVTGNTVVAKPAEQTALIAGRAVELMLEAGFPAAAIQLLPGSGAEIGAALTAHPAVAGVAFTGSIATARQIYRNLAARDVAPVPLIAETGGQNAMIVDATALPQQAVHDIVRSAFGSAGQRCSALRVLYLQEEIAEEMIRLIEGAMDQLRVGIPYLHDTDVGPVIDKTAKQKLIVHIARMTATQKKVAQIELDDSLNHGDFIAPCAFEIDAIDCLDEEKFGPILHIKRFKAGELAAVVAEINRSGYGLTLGIHSRIESRYRWIARHARVGNCYVNRDQIGAVVGVQPFGGQGLSGTGPKAGGPNYLLRFTEVRYDEMSQERRIN